MAVEPGSTRVRARLRSWDGGVLARRRRDMAEPVPEQVREADCA